MTQEESQVKVNLLSIHEFAKVCRTTPRTLRFYEKKGLFKPAMVDSFTKYRFYDPKQARDFLKIKLLQNFHIPLGQIAGYVSLRGAKNERRSNPKTKKIASLYSGARNDKNDKDAKMYTAEEYLQNRLKKLQEDIKEKEKEYKFLEKIKNFLFQTDSVSPPPHPDPLPRGEREWERVTKKDVFQIKTFGPYNLFCMKVEHGEYAKITDYIKTLWKEAERLKLDCEESEITFYLDNAYNPKNTPLEIALILKSNNPLSLRATAKQFPINSGIATPSSAGLAMTRANFYFKSYPKTKILAFKYIGPYEYLILFYQKLFSYIEDQNIKLKGLVFEKYKYGPLNTKSKYDYLTTIGFPI